MSRRHQETADFNQIKINEIYGTAVTVNGGVTVVGIDIPWQRFGFNF